MQSQCVLLELFMVSPRASFNIVCVCIANMCSRAIFSVFCIRVLNAAQRLVLLGAKCEFQLYHEFVLPAIVFYCIYVGFLWAILLNKSILAKEFSTLFSHSHILFLCTQQCCCAVRCCCCFFLHSPSFFSCLAHKIWMEELVPNKQTNGNIQNDELFLHTPPK